MEAKELIERRNPDDFLRIVRGRFACQQNAIRWTNYGPDFKPVNRWRAKLLPEEVSVLEALIGECLQEVGYPLTALTEPSSLSLRVRLMQFLYPRFFEAKLWLKSNTRLGRFAGTAGLELIQSPC